MDWGLRDGEEINFVGSLAGQERRCVESGNVVGIYKRMYGKDL